jgi:hypothetical protein
MALTIDSILAHDHTIGDSERERKLQPLTVYHFVDEKDTVDLFLVPCLVSLGNK